jgi:uncharacterized membrane protein
MKEWLVTITEHSVVFIDAVALVVILFGTIEACFGALKSVLTSSSRYEKREIWLRFARWLVVGLTFQLAADILETSITTGWENLVRLGVIAIVRTLLNYFLERDLAEIRERQQAKAE